jgi:hypothetical protein
MLSSDRTALVFDEHEYSSARLVGHQERPAGAALLRHLSHPACGPLLPHPACGPLLPHPAWRLPPAPRVAFFFHYQEVLIKKCLSRYLDKHD